MQPKNANYTFAKGALLCGLTIDSIVQNFGFFFQRHKLENLKQMLTWHSSPRRLAGEKKCLSYNHKTTIWVSHEYYLNPEFHKILSRAF